MRLPGAESVDEERGLEGLAAARYFPAFVLGLDKDFGFRKRVRRPPTDPINAVLSLLYTFLINRANAAVRLAGLEPYPGFLHSLEYGRHPLQDGVKCFPLCDRCAGTLITLGICCEIPDQKKVMVL